jgi:hypothetical protein
MLADAASGLSAVARIADATLRVVPPLVPLGAWAKLHRAGTRIVVFDRTGWHGVCDAAPSDTLVMQRGIVAGHG